MVAACFVEAGDEMGAAWTGRTGTHSEAARELRLARCGECRPFLVANADPFNVAAANRIGKWIERVADQCENVLDSDLFEHAN